MQTDKEAGPVTAADIRGSGKQEGIVMIKNSIKVGNIDLETRIIMPPMATAKCTENGRVTEDVLTYYAERAANPYVSLIITEHCFISQQGKAHGKQMSIASDEDVEGLSRLADVIHRNGAKAIAQINHAGSAASKDITGEMPVSASSIILTGNPVKSDGTVPDTLTKEGIKGIVADFEAAAKRAKAAGYDGVEIHSAHAYLLNQFYSPLTNTRTDEYGGSLENRLRIHLEVIEAVRRAVGDDVVAIRLGGCDYTEGGSTIDDCVFAAKLFEKAGADLVDLSGGICRFSRKGHEEAGYFQDMTSAVKAAVSLPVILTGGVKTPEEAEELLQKDAADLIGIGRELLKNPSWGE